MPVEVILIGLAALVVVIVYRGVAILKEHRQGSPAQPGMTCCRKPVWVDERDLGSARGFDLMLGKCGACGTPWINAFCVAASTSGYEPVTAADVQAIRSIEDPHELKQFMRRWVEYLA